MVAENALHAAELTIDNVEAIAMADVVDEEEEEEVVDNLRQFLPWFVITECAVCLLLWAVFAWQELPYTRISNNGPVVSSSVLDTLVSGTTVHFEDCMRACNGQVACVGVAFKDAPVSECRLLSSLHTSTASLSNCPADAFNWRQYAKGGFDLSVMLDTYGGLESRWPGQTRLQSFHYCEEGFRWSFLYRWFTYQFTHAGLLHVASNCFMALALGIPLEGLHGTGSMAIMWTTGVLGGALSWLLFDPYRPSYGASGGCYSLLGMHVADLVMNWRQKRLRFLELMVLLVITAVQAACYWATASGGASSTAHSVHAGGLAAGLLIGICVGRDIHNERWDQRVRAACWLTGIALCVLSAGWWLANPFPAIRSLWDPSERPWCWIGRACIGDGGGECPWRATPGSQSFGETFEQCVFCDTRGCVLGWYEALTTRQSTDAYSYCPRVSWSGCRAAPGSGWDPVFPPARSTFQ